jgi:N4-gp56 family major capsid protein
MANAYTTTGSSSLGGTIGGAGLVQKAYDRLIEFALRAQPLIRSVSDKTPAKQSIPGSSVVLQRYVDLTKVTSTLTETADPDAVALATPTYTTITLAEYGNAVLVTRALELFSLADVDPAVANIIAFNMADSIDDVAQTVLRGGDNVFYGGTTPKTSTATLTSSDTFTSALARKTTAKLRANKAIPRKGSLYWAGIHPEVAHDLRAETGVGSWRQPHEYQSNDAIWAGEIGTYEGAFYVESPRLYNDAVGAAKSTSTTTTTATSAQSSTVISVTSSSGILVSDTVTGTGVPTGAQVVSISGLDVTIDRPVTSATITSGASVSFTHETRVFNTYFAGQQALAEAVAEEPHVVIGPVVDKLMRHRPLGWYGVLGFARYREEALYRVETSSSINY